MKIAQLTSFELAVIFSLENSARFNALVFAFLVRIKLPQGHT